MTRPSYTRLDDSSPPAPDAPRPRIRAAAEEGRRPARSAAGRIAASFAALLAVLALACPAARAGEAVVVELFTSQSCYSCPPAEVLLGELVEHENVVALEFHVDYWDDLVYGSDGQWKDRFSDPAYTVRQRVYAGRIPGSQVYTPQIVVDGVAQTVGSRRDRVLRLIESARAVPKAARVSAQPESSGGFKVTVASGAGGTGAEVLLARYDRRHVTAIEAGENKGKTLVNHHVVRELRPLGVWNGEHFEVFVADLRLSPDQGCAVIVQAAGQGAILGAASCPS